ncbi:MAG: hypothetical protein JOY85_14070 [Acidobacteriaceae bacterium]|nr:hypothetical protein [Acidobacteriaceae bacterium]
MEVNFGADTCTVRADDAALKAVVCAWAHRSDRPVRPLHLQTLLQAPRLADAQGRIGLSMLDALISHLAPELPGNREWVVIAPTRSPRSLRFQQISSDLADNVTRRFHYLRSPRRDSHAYGLLTPDGNLVTLAVVSGLDVPYLQFLLSIQNRPAISARVVSRVFAFEGAPLNSISYLLSRCAVKERAGGASDLLTYVNPNLGFTGVSYRASGWSLLGEEPVTRYCYLDSRYITDRELALRFGALSDAEYTAILGDRFAVSTMRLKPLRVFHLSLV